MEPLVKVREQVSRVGAWCGGCIVGRAACSSEMLRKFRRLLGSLVVFLLCSGTSQTRANWQAGPVGAPELCGWRRRGQRIFSRQEHALWTPPPLHYLAYPQRKSLQIPFFLPPGRPPPGSGAKE